MHIQLKLNREMSEIFREILVDKETDDLPDDDELINEVVEHLKKGFDKEKMTFDERKYTDRKIKEYIPLELFRVMAYIVIKKIKERGSEITLYEIGYEFGKFLKPKNIRELKTFFRKNNLGILEIESRKPFILKVRECAMCDSLEVNEPICYFDAGLLAGALECILNKTVVVDEIKCMGQGYDACYFKIEIVKD
ncbi:V4R domain-containing protein [Methanotorris igneus]|uniref:4-vinyl reductase 4VR n=1 Tax=Methanotorris igneus (strain DSM 5666 / JCM 11834 / Kol 5) TaxID=880724 RepID=F6BEL3_METIK|nr:V4R domain-containing protein [Methanotorris igneus]AEF95674.1 4-vinyl reductase 4VR [Methanotorris igneus Kol 5]